jgi:hemerythrin-like domain-containing protein
MTALPEGAPMSQPSPPHESRPPRAARAAREPVAVPDSFEALDQTHRQVMQQLAQLQWLVDHLSANGIDAQAREIARQIIEFFSSTARLHHQEEERAVFPPLLGSDDVELVQHVRRLQQDHGWLEEDWLELSAQLESVAGGYSWYDADILRHEAQVFSLLYHEHIALEETVVYPEAKRRLAALADRSRRDAAHPS